MRPLRNGANRFPSRDTDRFGISWRRSDLPILFCHDEAAVWYHDQGEGSADRFLAEVDSAVASLEVPPQIYGARFADVRSVRLKRLLSYGDYHLIRGAEVRIIAVFLGARDPDELAA